jgi:hypothetical protein
VGKTHTHFLHFIDKHNHLVSDFVMRYEVLCVPLCLKILTAMLTEDCTKTYKF